LKKLPDVHFPFREFVKNKYQLTAMHVIDEATEIPEDEDHFTED
jgi:hypothetical protein